jgi:hypothetical protein
MLAIIDKKPLKMSTISKPDPEFTLKVKNKILDNLGNSLVSIISLQKPSQKKGDIDRFNIKMSNKFIESLAIPEEYWEEKTKWIENALESESTSEFNIPPLPENSPSREYFDEQSWRKFWIFVQYTATAAHELLREKAANINYKEVEQQVTWQRLEIGKATHKLSSLQKQVLVKLLEKTKAAYDNPATTNEVTSIGIKWDQEAWFGSFSREREPSLSKSLKNLEIRQLIERRSLREDFLPKRTSHIKLTDLGWAVGERLARAQSQK